MINEDRKFLDLDHVGDHIISQDDRAMFNEAVRCYQIGSHRAAVILAWCVTADCLYRRIDELATEGDGTAQKARQDLQPVIGTASYEENLITQAKICELFDEYEEKCLRFARDTRSKSAHPTGVIPSAEVVRNIFHICSQIVLCRDGYRGMSFIRQFVITKLEDRHLFSDKNRISDACRHYAMKVPERIYPQFAQIATEHVNVCTSHWKTNALTFFSHLLENSGDEVAKKIAKKFQPIESTNRPLFSILVGLDHREALWDMHVRNQAKAYLREALKTGKIDEYEFNAYANICAINGLDDLDNQLLLTRFSVFSEKLAKHKYFQERRGEDILTLVLESLEDSEARDQIVKGIPDITGSEIFGSSQEKTDKLIDILLKENWHDDDVSIIFKRGTDWSAPLKIAFLKRTRDFLMECSEDHPDDIFVVFEVANSILYSVPNVIPSEFENTLKEIVDGRLKPSWRDPPRELYNVFVRQIDLIRTQHSSHLSILADLGLNGLGSDAQGSDE